MPEEINQDVQPESNPDETAAVLSFATMLRGNLLKDKMAQEQPQMQENGSESVPNQKDEVEPTEDNKNEPEADMDTKFKDFKKEMKDMIKEEVSSIRESIQEALNEEE